MKPFVIVFCLAMLLIGAVETDWAQPADYNLILSNNDVFLSSAGRLVISSPATNRGMNRWAYMTLAVNKTTVYNWDDSTLAVVGGTVDSVSAGRKADYILRHVSSPAGGTLGAGGTGSKLQHIMTIFVWKDLKGFVVAYRYKNTGTSQVSGTAAYELYPRIDQTYTGHYLRWRSADSIAWFFRPGLAHFLGAKSLNLKPTGARLMTGSTFYKVDNFAEDQPDSVRYNAATYTSFDSAVDSAGTPRSMIIMGLGSVTIAAGDSSAPIYFAMAYDTDSTAMVTNIKSLESRYKQRILTGVSRTEGVIPTRFSLSQNYPNPFNPTTTIEYSVAKAGTVELKVYDVLGHELAVLVQGEQNPGNYSVVFDASRLSSGAYFYTMRAGDFVSTRSLVLMK
jgi:hypothetical protein